MLVDTKDGRCRTCGSQLDVVDADDISMHVVCVECGEEYDVETDAFGDGCMTYYLGIIAEKMEAGDGDED